MVFTPFWLCLDVRFAPNNDGDGGHSKKVETSYQTFAARNVGS
jgi:hypothetical protein